MPTKSRSADLYINRTNATVVMSALNTLTFQQIRFAAGLFEGIALLLTRVLWYPTNTSLRELVASTDSLHMALTTRSDLTAIDPVNLSVLVSKNIVGLATNTEPIITPLINDFSNMPGGGMLIPANPLYLGAFTAGAAAASSVRVVLEYRWKKLSPQESIELLQTLLPGTV